MNHKFQLGESVLYFSGGTIKKGIVVLCQEKLLDIGSIDVTYRVQCDKDDYSIYMDEWELARTDMELANNLLESYGFRNELRFRPVCEKCTRFITET